MKVKLRMGVLKEVGSGKLVDLQLEIKNPSGIGYLQISIPPKEYASLMLGNNTIKCKAQQHNGGLNLET